MKSLLQLIKEIKRTLDETTVDYLFTVKDVLDEIKENPDDGRGIDEPDNNPRIPFIAKHFGVNVNEIKSFIHFTNYAHASDEKTRQWALEDEPLFEMCKGSLALLKSPTLQQVLPRNVVSHLRQVIENLLRQQASGR